MRPGLLGLYPRTVGRSSASSLKWPSAHPFSSTFRLRSAQPPSPLPRKRRRLLRGLLYSTGALTIAGTGIYILDRTYYYSTLARTVRTLTTLATISADNWLNTPSDLDSNSRNSSDDPRVKRLRERNASRLFNLLMKNGGLYQKFGQVIASQSTAMPKEYGARFESFFDGAPAADMDEIEKLLRLEFSITDQEDVFDALFKPSSFDPIPVGSASIAQVHKAQLKSGEMVAVKIQKPPVKYQMKMDLLAFAIMVNRFGSELPAAFRSSMTEFIAEHLLLETDFLNEAANAERLRAFIAKEPKLRGAVYVPKTFPDYCTKRVMTAEWIDGVTIAQTNMITGPWKGKEFIGKPIEAVDGQVKETETGVVVQEGDNEVKVPVYGLGVKEKDVMTSMLNLFCAQTFLLGWVHCDPHPGNIFIRRLPSGKPQLVLLDHGLYIHLTPTFRHQWARVWQALLIHDTDVLTTVAEEWGIANAGMFSRLDRRKKDEKSPKATSPSDSSTSAASKDDHDQPPPKRTRPDLSALLADADKLPKELFFILRNMRLVEGNSKRLGSPIDRIALMGRWASAALARGFDDTDAVGVARQQLGWWARMQDGWRYLKFEIVLIGLGLGGGLIWRVQRWVRGMGWGTGDEGTVEKMNDGEKEKVEQPA